MISSQVHVRRPQYHASAVVAYVEHLRGVNAPLRAAREADDVAREAEYDADPVAGDAVLPPAVDPEERDAPAVVHDRKCARPPAQEDNPPHDVGGYQRAQTGANERLHRLDLHAHDPVDAAVHHLFVDDNAWTAIRTREDQALTSHVYFQHIFTTDPLTFQIRCKTKEIVNEWRFSLVKKK